MPTASRPRAHALGWVSVSLLVGAAAGWLAGLLRAPAPLPPVPPASPVPPVPR